MLDSYEIVRLFENVLQYDISVYGLTEDAIKHGIECMSEVYKGDKAGLKSERSTIADYTDPAHRCAYLHKYAALHTAMVRDVLTDAIQDNYNFFYRLVFSGSEFKICSLGGGPGTDIIGSLAALHDAYSFFDASAVVLDYMDEWKFSFNSILNELGTGFYGAFGNNTSHFLNWRYERANLLKRFQPQVIEDLSSASLVTMIKFASAAACMDTQTMIRNIFTAMKPGAVLLFIDNDGGGFNRLILNASNEFNFISVFGPHRQLFDDNFFRVKRFGYTSCSRTTVTAHILQKPRYTNSYDNFLNDNYAPFHNNRYLPGSPPTPFLYLGPNANYDNNFDETPYMSNFMSPASCLLTPVLNTLSPHTPALLPDPAPSALLPDPITFSSVSLLPDPLFSQDENLNNPYHPPFISSPVEEIPQVTITRNIVTQSSLVISPYTPNPQYKGKRARYQGCFPKFNLRHKLSKKLNSVKAKFSKKNKKGSSHPIFRL